MVFLDIKRTLVSNEQVKKGCKLCQDSGVCYIFSMATLKQLESWFFF